MSSFVAAANMSITITITNEDDFDIDEELIVPVADPEESIDCDPVDDSSPENEVIDYSEDDDSIV